jgi:hypothetical protein
MKRKHHRTLELIFSHPVSGSMPWRDIEALFLEWSLEAMSARGRAAV